MVDVSVDLPEWAKKNQHDDDKGIIRMYFFLMKELHLSYDDLQEMPVPALFALANELERFNKEQLKNMKKSQRK